MMTTHVTVLTCIIGLEPGMTRYVLMSTSLFARPRKVSFWSILKFIYFVTNVKSFGYLLLYIYCNSSLFLFQLEVILQVRMVRNQPQQKKITQQLLRNKKPQLKKNILLLLRNNQQQQKNNWPQVQLKHQYQLQTRRVSCWNKRY